MHTLLQHVFPIRVSTGNKYTFSLVVYSIVHFSQAPITGIIEHLHFYNIYVANMETDVISMTYRCLESTLAGLFRFRYR